MKKALLVLFVTMSGMIAGEWRIQAGAAVRLQMDCRIAGGSFSSIQGVVSHLPPGISTGGGVPVDAGGYGDREFLDGYVKMDPGTGDPGSLDPEYTWYWGYQQSSQLDAHTGMLAFRTPVYEKRTENFSRVAGMNRSFIQREDFHTAGIEFSASYGCFAKSRWGIDFAAGLSFFEKAELDGGGQVFSESVSSISTIHREQGIYLYDTGGISMPAPGYQGTYDGPFAVPPPPVSPMLPNRPSDIQISVLEDQTGSAAEYSQARVDVDYDISAQLSELNLGGNFYYQLTPSLRLNFVCGLLCALVDFSSSYHEEFSQVRSGTGELLFRRRWKDREDRTRFLFGLGAGAGAEYRILENLSLGGKVVRKQYFRDFHADLGMSEVTLDFSGVEWAVNVSWCF